MIMGMKDYVCTRCGKKFQGRNNRCPRCGQLFVYQRGEKYFDALGNEVVLDSHGHIRKRIKNPLAPNKK